MMDAIRTESLTKRYGDVMAVDELNLTVKPGELFALLGVNGHGVGVDVLSLAAVLDGAAGARGVGAVAGIDGDDDGLVFLGGYGQTTQKGQTRHQQKGSQSQGDQLAKGSFFHNVCLSQWGGMSLCLLSYHIHEKMSNIIFIYCRFPHRRGALTYAYCAFETKKRMLLL